MTNQTTNTPPRSLRDLIADDSFGVAFQTMGQYRAALLQQSAAPDALEGYLLMPERLTAKNGAKGALSCEYHETIDIECPQCQGNGEDAHGEDCPECDGTGKAQQRITVTWDTIKRIYAKAVEICAHNWLATSAAPSAAGTPEAPSQDAARYLWLKERFTGYDFYWGGNPLAEYEEDKGKVVIVFECGQDFRAGRNFEPAIDAAILRAAQINRGQGE